MWRRPDLPPGWLLPPPAAASWGQGAGGRTPAPWWCRRHALALRLQVGPAHVPHLHLAFHGLLVLRRRHRFFSRSLMEAFLPGTVWLPSVSLPSPSPASHVLRVKGVSCRRQIAVSSSFRQPAPSSQRDQPSVCKAMVSRAGFASATAVFHSVQERPLPPRGRRRQRGPQVSQRESHCSSSLARPSGRVGRPFPAGAARQELWFRSSTSLFWGGSL